MKLEIPALELKLLEDQGRTSIDCPLCLAAATLSISGALEAWMAHCLNCGESANSHEGWQHGNSIEKGYLTFEDMSKQLFDLYEYGPQKTLSTGWGELDELYKVRKGEICIVSGIPGHGKSNFLDALILNLAALHDFKTAIYSPENQPFSYHGKSLIEKFYSKPFLDYPPDPNQRISKNEIEKAQNWIGKRIFWLYPKEKSLEGLLKTAQYLISKSGINGILLDPWNEVDHQRPPNLTETEYISKSLTQLRNFARKHEVAIWLVVHPTKMRRDPATGKYPKPTPYDLAGSAHFYNKADVIFSVWRDHGLKEEEKRHEVQILVQKVRFKTVGKVGDALFRWYPRSGSFSPIGWENPLTIPQLISLKDNGK